MIDFKSQTQLADATADMMRACALAAARAASSSMFQGISFWARMVRSSAAVPLALFAGACAVHEPPAWSPLAGWREGSPILVAPGTTSSTQVTAHEPDGTAESTFSSYRSSSGHAVAQVIVPAG